MEEKQKLNKFEKTRLLSARAFEIAKGSEIKVPRDEKILLSKDYVKIAEEEFETNKLELKIFKR